MINQIDRYIIKKIIKCFSGMSLVFLSLINLFEFVELLRRSAGRHDVVLMTLFEMVLLKTPHNWQHFLVFLFFFGALMAFWTLSQNQELVVIQACGFSPLRLTRPIITVSFCVLLFSLFILNPLACALRERFLNLEGRCFGGQPALSVSGSSLWLRDNNPLTLLHAQTFHLGKAMFWNVRFFDFSKGYKSYYFAKRANLLPTYQWRLEDVIWWDATGKQGKMKTILRPTHFSIKKIERVQRPPDTVPFFQLKQYSHFLAKHGFSVTRYDLYWHSFLAKGIFMISLGFLAMGLCLNPPRHYKQMKLISSGIFICFVLHFLQDLIHALSLAHKIPIELACWGFPISLTALSLRWITRKD